MRAVEALRLVCRSVAIGMGLALGALLFFSAVHLLKAHLTADELVAAVKAMQPFHDQEGSGDSLRRERW